MRRFSQTVSSPKRPRPSGTCATPSRATDSGERFAIERPSNTTSPVLRTVPEIARSVVVLPAPFAPSSDDDLALVDRERDAVQRADRPVARLDVEQLKQRHRPLPR